MSGAMAHNDKIIPVILCGGTGTRLWPLSRQDTPKQFLRLGGDNSLLVDTVDRALKCSGAPPSDVVIVTLEQLRRKTESELADYDPAAATHILGEPAARNTAAAVAYAAHYAAQRFGRDVLLWVLPADHYVSAPAKLKYALDDAVPLAREGRIVTFGIHPDSPETGYGYIRKGDNIADAPHIFTIDSFLEKPNRDTAAAFIEDGEHVWNSGMFLFSARTGLNEFLRHAPTLSEPIGAAMTHDSESRHLSAALYAKLPSVPFDKAIMERTDKGAVVVCDIGWSDIGSWDSLWHLRDKDARGNSVSGRAAVMESRNCLVQASSLLVAAIGLEDVAIVESGDTILVADKKNPDAMRALVAALDQAGTQPARHAKSRTYPWGSQRVLSESPGYCVREITIKPGGALDTHYHLKRCEFWTVISGEACVTIGDTVTPLGPQQNCFIPIGTKHALENSGSGDLVVVEVQCGAALGDEDILRDTIVQSVMVTA